MLTINVIPLQRLGGATSKLNFLQIVAKKKEELFSL